MRAHQRSGGHQRQVEANTQLALWTLAWTASVALAVFGPSYLWDSPAASWTAVALNVAVGIGWIIAHARYLRGIDELQRKIMQDALAVTLGVGWVGGFAYLIADTADLVATDINVGLFPVLLAVVYIVAIIGGHVRYR